MARITELEIELDQKSMDQTELSKVYEKRIRVLLETWDEERDWILAEHAKALQTQKAQHKQEMDLIMDEVSEESRNRLHFATKKLKEEHEAKKRHQKKVHHAALRELEE